MKKILKKLVKFTKIHFYENACKLIQEARATSGIYKSIVETESFDDVFSDEKLIDGKYYYIRTCIVDEFIPTYKTRFINLWSEDKVKRWVIDKVQEKLSRSVKNFDIHTYMKKKEFIHKVNFSTYEGEPYEDSESGEDKIDSKLILLDRCMKFLNHMKYEHRKTNKK